MRACLLFLAAYYATINSIESSCCQEDKIQYYETIINQTVEESSSYKLRTNNGQFRSGIKSTKVLDYGSYDFVVIGGGTAGSIVATRLSEHKKWNILLIEAGLDQDDFSLIPYYAGNSQKSDYNWGYKSTPQKNACLAMNNNSCSVPRGQGLGGSNLLNAMVYMRGRPEDYNNWKSAGNSNWGWNDVFPYFLKSENSEIDGDPGYHGEDGLWNVQYLGPPNHLVANFTSANIAKGLDYITDYNGKKQIGVSHLQFCAAVGQRLTAAEAFFGNARDRVNVNYTLNSYATKIEFNDANEAQSVIFVKDGKKYRVKAKKEVIVSGGSINSPQLLMLSGIGPKEELVKHNISLVADLPVGQNLHDHPNFVGTKFMTNVTDATETLHDQVEQLIKGTGPLTIPLNQHTIAFYPSKDNRSSVPMLEILFGVLIDETSTTFENENFKSEIIEKYLKKTKFTQLQINQVLYHPVSVGNVTLQSSDPVDFPLIDLNQLSDENDQDLNDLLEGFKHVLSLAETDAFKQINATFIQPPVCQNDKPFSDSYLKCLIRHFTQTLYHPISTNIMKPQNQGGVVDQRLKVYNVTNLRVIDASIFPNTVSAHTNAPTAMVAEKASDLIKEDYGLEKDLCYILNI